jgi:hypothetical protein
MEEREFQVKLAALEADVQIHLTAAFGFLAVLAGLILADEQIFYTLPADQWLTKWALFGVIIAGAMACAGVFSFFVKKAMTARKDMEKLIPPATPAPAQK